MVSRSGGIFGILNWRTLLKGQERFVIESGALRFGKYVQNCIASHSNRQQPSVTTLRTSDITKL